MSSSESSKIEIYKDHEGKPEAQPESDGKLNADMTAKEEEKEEESKAQNEESKNEVEESEKEISVESEKLLIKEENIDEEERELREKRCKRLMHLLKRSRMYAAELTNQVKRVGMGCMRRKKTITDKQNVKYEKNGVNVNNSNGMEVLEKMDEEDCDLDVDAIEDDVNFFRKTRITKLGFEVSDYQPVLVEGGTMRDYQLKGLQWLTTLFANGVNGILADEMGLGKTLQVIALLCSLIEKGISGPFLIIAPLSTIGNWMREFRRFAPKVPTLFFQGSKQNRKNLFTEIMESTNVLGLKVLKVVITSYEIVLLEKKPLSKVSWHYVVVDEGHRIKNHNSQLSRTLRSFESVGKLLITGTPLQNNLSELWSLLNFIVPEVFSSLDVFESWFDIQELESDGVKFIEENYKLNVISTLQQILIPFILRREKKDVNLKLPAKKEILVYCPMTAVQKKLYEATVDRSIERLLAPKRGCEEVSVLEPLPKRACVLYKNLKSDGSNSNDYEKYREKYCSNGEGNEGDCVLNIIMRNPQMQLRKIVNHPYLIQFPLIPGTSEFRIDEDLVKNSGKLLVVDAMLSKLKARGHKVIIFSTFTLVLDILEKYASLRGYRYCRFDGISKLEEREESICQFNVNPSIFLFFLTMRAGGLGINLTGADTIIMYDSDWNPQINLQSQDRCHRIGQKKPVVIYKLCVRGTIDERIVERGNAKRRLEKMIIQKGKFTKGAQDMENSSRANLLDFQELKDLLSSTDYDSVIHSNGFVFTDEELDALLDRSDMTNELTESMGSDKENVNGKIFRLLKSE